MTIRELVNQLLNEDLDDEVKVSTFDQYGDMCHSDVDGVLKQDKPGITVLTLD